MPDKNSAAALHRFITKMLMLFPYQKTIPTHKKINVSYPTFACRHPAKGVITHEPI
jgi:hypothetical protein